MSTKSYDTYQQNQVTVLEVDVEQPHSVIMSIVRDIWAFRNILVIILIPVLLLPVPLVLGTSEAQCGYVVLIMAVYWITEALPIAVTSLLPIVLFPVVGVLPAKEVSSTYLNDTTMLFVGGLIVAAAIEHWNIHRRIALTILVVVGAEPKWLMFGLMLPTWFLSMWISNTATTAMMMPIANAILLQLKDATQSHSDKKVTKRLTVDSEIVLEVTDAELENGTKESKLAESHDPADNQSNKSIDINGAASQSYKETVDTMEYLRMCKALSLCIAYSANTGGIASLTGTLPNVVMKGQADIVFQEYGEDSPVTFATWMVFGLPLSLVVVLLLWMWLQLYFLRFKGCFNCLKRNKDVAVNTRVKLAIKKEYEKLGKITFAEGGVIAHFIVIALLWITRDLGGIGGWGRIFKSKFATDAVASILIGCSVFIFPSVIEREKNGRLNIQPLLTWKVAQEKLPWGVFLLLGGGFALAKGCKTSGLSEWVGSELAAFAYLEPWVFNMVLCFIVAGATEVTSNTAICTLMMPIVASLALTLNINPLYFMFPTAIATSFAFMLPVATPPNAVVFSYGHVRVIDMVSAGFMVNIFAVLMLVLATETWGSAFFDLHTFPAIFQKNITTTSVNVVSFSPTISNNVTEQLFNSTNL